MKRDNINIINRSNLDPFESYGDVELWDALESVYMKDAISKLPQKLDSPVIESMSYISSSSLFLLVF